MKNIVIFGATGNLGGLTAEAISKNHPEYHLVLTSSRESGVEQLQSQYPDATVLLADWYKPETLRPALVDADRVLVVTPDFYTDENVVTPNLIAAIKEFPKIEQIVRFIAIPEDLKVEDLSEKFLATQCGANQHIIAKPQWDDSQLPMTYVNAPCWITFNLPWFLADEVKRTNRLCMPAVTDASRLWVTEGDIAAVFAKILTDVNAEVHIGAEYVLTGQQRYNYSQLAQLLSEVTGKKVEYVDDSQTLNDIMGDSFDLLMTYFEHETKAYDNVEVTNTIEKLLGRSQVDLKSYLMNIKDLFI